MKLTLAQMEAFFWTARLGSTTAAAQHLGLTQPSVSLRLQDLQRITGRNSFRRTAAGLRLTEEGRRLLDQVTSVLEMTRAIAGEGGTEAEGSFRLGFAEGFAMIYLPRLLPALQTECPRLRPELMVSTSRELEAGLMQGELDLAVISDPISSGLRYTPLGSQKIVWIAGASSMLAPVVTPQSLEHAAIVVNLPGSPMYRRMLKWFGAAGLEPSNVGYCSSGAAILHLVSAGLAASLAPERMARAHAVPQTLRLLKATPALEPGALFVAQRVGASSSTARIVSTVIGQVVRTDQNKPFVKRN